MNHFKTYYLLRILLSTGFGVGVGVLLLFLRGYASEIFGILQIAMGLGAALFNILPFAASLAHIRQCGEWVNLLLSLASIALGVALMLVQQRFLLVLLILYGVVLPLFRILLVSQHKRQLLREWPYALLGIFMMVVFLTEAERTVFLVGGMICFALSALYLVCALLRMRSRLRAVQALDTQT